MAHYITHRYLLAPTPERPVTLGIRWLDATGDPARLEIPLEAGGTGTIPADVPADVAQECILYAHDYGVCLAHAQETTPS